MSLKAVFEIILHLNQFTNVELPHQGLAAISASIYKLEKGKEVVIAVPYEFPYQRTYKMSKNKIKQDSSVQDMFFRSKVGFIKYSDQKIFLDDFVQFRLQLQAFPSLDTDNVFLQFNLIFTSRYYAAKDEPFQGTPVSKIKIKLKDIQNGIINYSQVGFKGDYPSKISFVLFCHLMHYKFQKYNVPKQPSSKQISRAKLQNLEDLIIWSKGNLLEKDENPIPLFYSSYVKNLRHSNYLIQSKLNECLIVKRKINMKVSKSYLQSIGYNGEIDQKIFRQYLQTYQPINSALNFIAQEIHQIRIENFEFLQQVINQFYHDQLDVQKMTTQFNGYIKQKFGERVFRNIIYQGDKIENALKNNKKIAKQMRSKQISLSDYPLESQAFLNNKDEDEFIFYQITLPLQYKNKQKIKKQKKIKKSQTTKSSNNQSDHDQSSSQNTQKSDHYEHQTSSFFSENKVQFEDLKYNEKNMLIVMCHGFQGSSYDMSLIHRGLKTVLPNAAYLISRKNQDDTQGDIEHMGEKLADQIKYYIRAFMDENKVIINFIGHSMGGIIARASFKHLRNFRDQFGFYCTLSTPHLGYLNGVDGKIKAGLWVLRKWKPIRSLDQLSMDEAKHPRDSYLYRLSKEGSLKYFRKIILFSSFQDSYVAWHSARISLHQSKNSQAKVQNEMVQNILGLKNGINQQTTIHRLDINFNVKGNSIDSLIGRAAHINLIVQDSLFDVVNITLPKLFDLKEYQTGIIDQ